MLAIAIAIYTDPFPHPSISIIGEHMEQLKLSLYRWDSKLIGLFWKTVCENLL